MNDDDRFERLERRLLVLEELVRKSLPASPESRPLRTLPTPAAPPAPVRGVDWATRLTKSTSPKSRAPTSPVELPRPVVTRTPREKLSTEQWFGQRGMLGVGVLLLLLAGAYFLKVAIDRGWISPATRCVVAVLAGHAVIALGWRLYRRGTERYGATLIGAGSGLIYLGIWAAARWYSLVAPEIGIVGLLYVGIATTAIAYRLDLEALGGAAAVGALLGPIVISADAHSVNALLMYLAGVGATLGVTAMRRNWRSTTLLIVISSIGLAWFAIPDALPMLAIGFSVIGGLACIALRRKWNEVAALGFLGAWLCLFDVMTPTTPPWLTIAAALMLAAPIWFDGLQFGTTWPDGAVRISGEQWSVSQSIFFYLMPAFVGALIESAFPAWAAASPPAIPLLIAVPYLIAGYVNLWPFRPSRASFALVGTTAAAAAALVWPGDGIAAVMSLLGLSLLWAGLDHLQNRNDGRWFSLLSLTVAGARLIAIVRPANTAAFHDAWALVLWALIASSVALALGIWRVESVGVANDPVPEPAPGRRGLSGQESFLDASRTLPPQIPAMLWTAAGLMLLAGVTGELIRLVGQLGLTPEAVRLASGLAVSAWWAVYAGGLVLFGFYRKLKAVRIAGLLVAGLAVFKVLFFDLANLDQLYRVASFIILAIVLLLVAYLYNRQAANASDALLAAPTDGVTDGSH